MTRERAEELADTMETLIWAIVASNDGSGRVRDIHAAKECLISLLQTIPDAPGSPETGEGGRGGT